MSQRSERILVVDGDAKLRGLLMDALRGGGYQADGVVDGLEAVNRLKAGGWDLVLTDLQMPGLDGLALIRWMKQEGDQTPVILVTGSADHPACAEARTLGAKCVHKPFRIESLLAAVGEALSGSGRMDAPDPWAGGWPWA